MKIFLIALLACLSLSTFAAAQTAEINIIPKPKSIQRLDGYFELNQKTRFVVRNNEEQKLADLFNSQLQRMYGFKLKTIRKDEGKENVIFFADAIDPNHQAGEIDTLPPEEWYSLSVNTKRIGIGATGRGQFNALQTLLQLLPVDIKREAKIPAVKIVDFPRFQYRGMHLDVGRHFMPVSFVKKYIDLMSQYKFNYFHWHLTEDQGWRIEIKKWPKLTEIGSKRPESVKERNLSPYIGDGVPVEGFYTQDEIKDVVAYAKSKYITVIPEIELPGHASAALAAYPELGCKEGYQYKVQTTWGIFKEVFCPTDKTFGFLEDVLTETIALFPDSPYIHIGGDEVLKDHWKESAFVQELKAKENLKDEHEVQSYFIRRIEKFINSKGKKIIGWDEILEGGLAPNATVMSWRGMKGGIEAAKSKHDVIMTPTDFAYLNFGQGDHAYEPLSFPDYIPLDRVYSFDPVPKELSADEAKYVIGGQGNLWTEYIKTPETAEYMLFPRMIAMSEVLWSPAGSKNYSDFLGRLAANLPRLDKQNVNYRIPEPAGLQNVVLNNGKTNITLQPQPGTRVHYTVDGSTPDEKSPAYSSPIEIELKEGEIATLKTVVVNPTGRKSAVYAATLIRRDMIEPSVLEQSTPGVKYSLIDTRAGNTMPVADGETRTILLNQFEKKIDLKQPFMATFSGYFNVPADGVYELQVDSTWDATVKLGGERIIDDQGTKDRKVRSVIVPLKKGLHPIELTYNHRGGDLNFRFRWGIKGQGLRQAYGGEFVH